MTGRYRRAGSGKVSVSVTTITSPTQVSVSDVTFPSVAVVAASDITLSGTQTVDGYASLADGDLILCVGQSDDTENRVWIYNSSGAYSPSGDDIAAGFIVYAQRGTSYAGTLWVCTTTGTITLGTTSLAWDQVANGIVYAKDSYLGIGTDNPTYPVHVLGASGDTVSTLYVECTSTTTNSVAAGDFRQTDTGNIRPAVAGTNVGNGDGLYGEAQGSGHAVHGIHDDTGNTVHAQHSGSGHAVAGSHSGTGRAGTFEVTNGSGTEKAVYVTSNRPGGSVAAQVDATGGGSGIYVTATSTGTALVAQSNGTGRTSLLYRNVSSPTASMLSVQEVHSTGSQTTVEVLNAGSGDCIGIGGGGTGKLISGTRNNASGSDVLLRMFQDHASDNNNVAEFETDGGGYAVVATSNGAGAAALVANQTSTGNIADFWDNGSSVMQIRDGGEIAYNASQGWKFSSISASTYTADSSDCILGVSPPTGGTTITLPSSAGLTGQMLIIKDVAGNANTRNITISRAGSDTIDGLTSKTINTAYGVWKLFSDGGSGWFTF